MDRSAATNGLVPLLEHLKSFLEGSFHQLLREYRNDDRIKSMKLAPSQFIKESELYLFMEELTKVSTCRFYLRSSNIDSFYGPRGGRGYVNFL